MVIFLDTYALIEIDKGSLNYKEFSLEPIKAITTVYNLVEVHFYYLKNYGEKEANLIYDIVKDLVVKIDDSIVKEANIFKIKNLKKRLSFADCIGYLTALKYKAKFLTGDYQFKGMENVEFVR